MLRKILLNITLCTVAIIGQSALTSCFTGVESTPKITARDIRARNANDTPESLLLADLDDIMSRPFAPGRTFYVTDNRISLAFSTAPGVDFPENLKGSVLTLSNIDTEPTISGNQQYILKFTTDNGTDLFYRPAIADTVFNTKRMCYVPFTIDKAMVDTVNARLSGRDVYILVAQRFDPSQNHASGMRYIPVKITGVQPSYQPIPLKVSFTQPDGSTSAVLMSSGTGASASRNFETLFSFTDPRLKYKQIAPEIWDDIMHSRIRLGMTPVECRLALGSPNSYNRRPSSMGMVEFWQYDNGKYLYFEDGVLARFRN